MLAVAPPPAEFVGAHGTPQPEALRRTPVCSLGCPLLDRCAAAAAARTAQPWRLPCCAAALTHAALCRPHSLLHGGIPGGSVTELVGESTVGKTQLCLQLLLTAQLPESAGGLGGRSMYIHTEGNAPLSRLASLAAGFAELPAACDAVLVANASAGPEQLLDAVQQARQHCTHRILQS